MHQNLAIILWLFNYGKNSFEVLVRSFVLNFSFENLKVILVFMLQQLLYLTFDVALNYKFSYFAGNCKYALNN